MTYLSHSVNNEMEKKTVFTPKMIVMIREEAAAAAAAAGRPVGEEQFSLSSTMLKIKRKCTCMRACGFIKG